MHSKAPKPLIIGMLAAFGTGLIALLLLKKGSDERTKRSQNAPQLNLNNPGSQDEFLQAPTESEIG